MTKLWGCVALIVAVCLNQVESQGQESNLDTTNTATRFKIWTKEFLPDNLTTTLSASKVDSKWALFGVHNASQGITITITPLCLDQSLCSAPQSLHFAGIFLPTECSLVPCKHQLVKIEPLNETTTQYLIGVSSVQSMLLLRFLFDINTRHFELQEKAVVNRGIVNKYNCNPTSTVLLNEDLYTLCANAAEGRLRPLKVSDFNSFRDTSFNVITDRWIAVTYPIRDVSVVSHSEAGLEYILFGSGNDLTVINPKVHEFRKKPFPECRWTINKLQLRNDTNIDFTIPYLVYCDYNYGSVNINDLNQFLGPYSYSETGYPIVCQMNNSIIASLTVATSGHMSTLHYGEISFHLPGQNILLENSVCFGSGGELFYLYTDLNLGTVLFDLHKNNSRQYSSCQRRECFFPRVFQDYFVLLEEQYSNDSVTLRLFNAIDQQLVADATVTHSAEPQHVHLLTFPESARSEPQGLSDTEKAVIGIFIIIFIGAVVASLLIVWYIRKKKSHNGSIYGIQETAVTYNPIDMESISYSDTNSSASVSDQEALELDIPVDQELTTIDPMEQEALNTNPVDQKPTNIEASLVTGFKNTPVTY